MFILGILLGLAFLFGPFVVPSVADVSLPTMPKVFSAFFGVGILLFSGIALVITRLYRKTSADEAFVRTGMGGNKAIVNGGCIVLPLVHTITPVTLQTLKIPIERKGATALQTADNLRADVTAVFYIRVENTDQDVQNAAKTLGQKASNPALIEKTVEEKLDGVLRSIAKMHAFEQLNSKRDDFASAVKTALETDLQANGLKLETVTIPFFDQTPPEFLKPDQNIIDAQGMRRIAEITQEARIKTNQIQREADQQVKDQDVETDKYIYQREVEVQTAEAERDKQIRIAKERTTQEGAAFAIQQDQAVQLTEVTRDQSVKVAKVDSERAIEIANATRTKQVETAKIESDTAVELAQREKQITVNEAEKRRAVAEAERLAAEALAETNRQAIRTVEVTAAAQREKQKTVIDAEANAEREKRQLNMQVDIEAYRLTELADAERKAAENKATAVRTEAEAKRDALAAQAAGQQALEMVPVIVERERVAVGREDLKNKAEFEKISSGLTVRLAEIEASRDVHIATANAVGQAMANAKLTLWGTPEQAVHMTQAWMKGQGIGTMVDGLLTSVAGEGGNSLANITDLVKGVVGQLAGVNASPHSGDTTHTSEDPKHN